VQVLQVGQDVRSWPCSVEHGDCQRADLLRLFGSNLCGAVRATQGKGVMPDGTTRFKCKGKDIHHFVLPPLA
jgi:Zn-dependent alcohol dehydrogenase